MTDRTVSIPPPTTLERYAFRDSSAGFATFHMSYMLQSGHVACASCLETRAVTAASFVPEAGTPVAYGLCSSCAGRLKETPQTVQPDPMFVRIETANPVAEAVERNLPSFEVDFIPVEELVDLGGAG